MLSILIVNLELHKLYASVPAVYPGAHDRFSSPSTTALRTVALRGVAEIQTCSVLSIGYSVVTSDVVGTVRQIALSAERAPASAP